MFALENLHIQPTMPVLFICCECVNICAHVKVNWGRHMTGNLSTIQETLITALLSDIILILQMVEI